MEKRLKEIEESMRSILEEVNKLFSNKYQNAEISLWAKKDNPFTINFWDGKDHAPLSRSGHYAGTPKELIKWVTKKKKREILFQKFSRVI